MTLPEQNTNPVVVTGRGVLTPFGLGLEALSNGLRNGESAVEDVELAPLEGLRPAALLPAQAFSEWLDAWLGTLGGLEKRVKKLSRRAPRPIIAALPSAVDAWLEAGLGDAEIDPMLQGVVVGGHEHGHLPGGVAGRARSAV